MLTIIRTYFNFTAKDNDGKTPAMRLGLDKGPARFEESISHEIHDDDLYSSIRDKRPHFLVYEGQNC